MRWDRWHYWMNSVVGWDGDYRNQILLVYWMIWNSKGIGGDCSRILWIRQCIRHCWLYRSRRKPTFSCLLLHCSSFPLYCVGFLLICSVKYNICVRKLIDLLLLERVADDCRLQMDDGWRPVPAGHFHTSLACWRFQVPTSLPSM